jgi:hypothetical protein
MVKDSDRLRGGFEVEEGGGGLSGLLAEEDEFDRRTLWRLGTWASVSIGAVIMALITNQSSIGLRREQTASADLIKQAQQIQLAARESQNESRRLASAVDTLNSDRDRLYSRVAVLEQGLDSVTGAIARQAPAPPPPQASASPASSSQTSSSQTSASAAPPANPSAPSPASPPSPAPASTASMAAPAATASTTSAASASVDPPPTAAKASSVAPVVAPVAATAPAVVDKQDKVADKQDKVADKKDKQAATVPPPDPSLAVKSAAVPPSAPAQPSVSLMASKSMMAPPDPAAGKLIEPAAPPKTVTSAPLPEVVAVAPKASKEAEPGASATSPELVAQHTEFGVDVGGANSIPGLRALWHGLLKSKSNAALTTLRPIIVIKENNNGLGMQLRLVAGPISDAAAAAKICASLVVNDRGCSTTVFEGQRLAVSAEEQAKADTKIASESKPASDPKADSEPKISSHRRYLVRHLPREEEAPKQEPSTMSLIFGKH